MSLSARVHRPITWLNLSTAALVALLQRSPVARMVEFADEFVESSPAGAMLKSAVAAAASLGGLDSLAGASVLSSSASSPLSATVGGPITPVLFTITDTITVGSWAVTGSIPPGLTITDALTGEPLSASGTIDGSEPDQGDPTGGSNGSYPSTTPELSGTPTRAGTYTFNLQGYQYAFEQGPASGFFPFTVVVGTAGVASIPPSITLAPLSQSVTAGSAVIFTATASGSPSPTYQWNFDGVAIPGATGTSYGIRNASSANIGSYTVTAANSAGSAASAAATLAVTGTAPPPAFITQPISVSVVNGSTVALDALATGSPTYQWSFNGVAIPGATDPTLVINGATAADVGNFALTATNGGGSVTSSTATVSIAGTSDVGRLVNLSCRASVSSGANILISGFVVGGAGTGGSKPMLVLASGPTLATYGVPGSLPDPELQLTTVPAGTVLGSNTGWANNPTITAESNAVGTTPFSAGTADSALFVTEPAGGYTAQISGASNDSGAALVEVFDATPAGTYTATTPRLINLSARAQVGTGGGILIAGFVIGDSASTARTVLIRASGPSLGSLGLSGTLPDPQLVLTTVGGAFIAGNTGWGGNPAIIAAANSVTSFTWPSSSADSALLVTLPPGAYTAQISGASGDGGLVLAEIYEIP